MSDMFDRIKQFVSASGAVPRFAVASQQAVENAERALGFSLPPLLKRGYLELSNGGFGPGFGIIGVEGGCVSDYGDLVGTYNVLKHDQTDELRKSWNDRLLPICGWGCTMLSCVKCDGDLRMYTHEGGRIFGQNYVLDDFFEMWINGTDILMQDQGVTLEDVTFTNPFTKRKQTMKIPRRRDA